MSKRTLTRLKYTLLIVLYVMAAWRSTYLFILEPGLPREKRTILSTTLKGKADKPFAYRMLVPEFVKGVVSITPESWKKVITGYAEAYRWKGEFLKKLGWEKEYFFENLVTTALIFVVFLSSFFVMRSLIYAFFQFPEFIQDLAPLASTLFLPMFFVITDYIYDPADLLFSGILLLLIQKRMHFWFLPMYILACFNKETAILFAFVFLLKEYGRMPVWRLTSWMIAILAIAISIKLTTFFIYENNKGSFVELQLKHNWYALIFKGSYPPYFHFAAILWGFLLSFHWTRKPVFLRHAFFVIFIPEFILGVFFGWIDEIRIFLDAYPTMFLLGLPTIITLFDIPLKRESEISS